MWGSERRPPACKIQSLPASTPHVGQGTASSSCGVRSVIFTDQAYCDPYRTTVQIWTVTACSRILSEMKNSELTPKQVSSVRCPACGVSGRKSCVLHSGAPRSESHVDGKFAAIEAADGEPDAQEPRQESRPVHKRPERQEPKTPKYFGDAKSVIMQIEEQHSQSIPLRLFEYG